MQERLTVQIADWLDRELAPAGAGVVLEAEHTCLSLRGVAKPGAQTVTSSLRGSSTRRRSHTTRVPLTSKEHVMAESSSLLIVGASLAGASAAAALARRASRARSSWLGRKRKFRTSAPSLKEYLRGESSHEAAQVHPPVFYSEQEIELRTGTEVVSLNVRDRFATLGDGAQNHYDKLLLCTGAEPRRAAMPGADLAGTHYLRTTSDSDSLRARLAAGTRLLVVGGGWIGCEVAASAVSLCVCDADRTHRCSAWRDTWSAAWRVLWEASC